MPSSWLSSHNMTRNTAALTSIPVSTVATAAGTRWRRADSAGFTVRAIVSSPLPRGVLDKR